MRKIRIKICGFDKKDEFSYGYFFLNILKKYYNVELSENPEYIFYTESSYEYLNYDCIRIFFTGENVIPNFNLCDYAIGFDYMNFGDRCYRLPLYLITVFYNKKEVERAGDTDFVAPTLFTKKDLEHKTEFCSFVYSNYLSEKARRSFFDILSKYKKVNAGGGYLNNIGGRVSSKLDFESKHKFSIAFENSSRTGYTTEKIVNSLAAKTIPIYWGNPDIGKEFNEKRFINCHAYESFEKVIERVKEIDNDDDLYLSIVNEQVTVKEYDFKEVRNGVEDFLRNIIDQPLILAKRRSINPARAKELEKHEIIIANYVKRKTKIKKVLAKLYQPFKKIKLMERLKHLYFDKK